MRETDGTLEKKLRHWQIFRTHSPPSLPSLLLLPFASSRLSGKRKKISKRLSWPDSHFSPSITSLNNGLLNCNNCDYISNFVPFCRMRLVRPLLGLVLGLSIVSSRILEDGELIDNNSILEVDSCLYSVVITRARIVFFWKILEGERTDPAAFNQIANNNFGAQFNILSQVIIF